MGSGHIYLALESTLPCETMLDISSPFWISHGLAPHESHPLSLQIKCLKLKTCVFLFMAKEHMKGRIIDRIKFLKVLKLYFALQWCSQGRIFGGGQNRVWSGERNVKRV